MKLTATINDEGDRPITVFGTWSRAEPDVGLPAGVEVEGAELDGAPYDLSKPQLLLAEEALAEARAAAVEKSKAQAEDAETERRSPSASPGRES